MDLTPKGRLLAAARGEYLDQLPFGARLDLWYNYHLYHNSLPEQYLGWSIEDIARSQGAGIQIPVFSVVKETYPKVEVLTTKSDDLERIEYRTPFGILYKETRWTSQDGSWLPYEVNRLFKSEEDYPAILHLIENTVPVENFEELERTQAEIGENGLVLSGAGMWTPIHRIMREFMGYERFFYELVDRPMKVRELLEVVEDLDRRKYEVADGCNLEIYDIGGNWSDIIHTPVFQEFYTPWLREVCEFLHSKGKLALVHVDGEMKKLLPFMRELEVDIAEGITPYPQTAVTMVEFKDAFGEDTTLWGGIPTILFEPSYSDEEFRKYVKQVLTDMTPGNRFILGMGDNFPVTGDINRVGMVAELLNS
jgi:hypothetical protein